MRTGHDCLQLHAKFACPPCGWLDLGLTWQTAPATAFHHPAKKIARNMHDHGGWVCVAHACLRRLPAQSSPNGPGPSNCARARARCSPERSEPALRLLACRKTHSWHWPLAHCLDGVGQYNPKRMTQSQDRSQLRFSLRSQVKEAMDRKLKSCACKKT